MGDGECFSWAYQNLPSKGEWQLVQAMVHDPWDKQKTYPHAWIESMGRVYDWQSVEKGLGPGKKGWPRDKFYKAYEPFSITRYDAESAHKALLKHKHYGPWT